MKLRIENEQGMTELGKRLAAVLNCGDCILLDGEMGAGKSVMTRGIARGLGITGPIPSPTFTILNVHEGPVLQLYHFDFYRMSGADELYEAGLDEFIPPQDGVAVIEWPDIVPEVLPAESIRIHIEHDGDSRILECIQTGRLTDEALCAVFGEL